MSNNNKLIVGLDIGTTKVCAIVGQRNENGKINILGVGSKPSLGGVMRGEVTNISKTVDAIKGAIEIASKISNVEINAVHVGIAGEHIKSFQQPGVKIRENSDSEITQAELDAMNKEQYRTVVDPGEKILHALPQEYTIDRSFTIKDPVGMLGTKLECKYHIVTGRVSAAKTIVKCVENAGLTASDVIVEPIASAYAVLSEEELEAGIAIIDIGGGTTDLAIFHDGKIRHTAVIPYGGEIVTADIVDAFGIIEKQAELIKVKYGHATVHGTRSNVMISVKGIGDRKPKQIMERNLAHVINARIKEIIEMVKDEIVLSGYKNKLNLGVVLTGGGAQLKDLRELAELILGCEVKIGLPDPHLGKGLVDEVRSPMYATCIGLVLRGFQDMDANINDNIQKHIKPNKSEKPTNKKSLFDGLFGGFKDWIKDDQTFDDFNK
jgi:cell division protein FtsA